MSVLKSYFMGLERWAGVQRTGCSCRGPCLILSTHMGSPLSVTPVSGTLMPFSDKVHMWCMHANMQAKYFHMKRNI